MPYCYFPLTGEVRHSIHDTNLRKHHKGKARGETEPLDFFRPRSLSCPCSQDLGVQVSPNPTSAAIKAEKRNSLHSHLKCQYSILTFETFQEEVIDLKLLFGVIFMEVSESMLHLSAEDGIS